VDLVAGGGHGEKENQQRTLEGFHSGVPASPTPVMATQA
jgi:hypothetical protein